MDSFSPFFIKMELENDVHRGRDYLIGHVLPSRPSDESLSVVEVEVPVLSMWQKSEVYLQMISVAMLIVAVTFVGWSSCGFIDRFSPTSPLRRRRL